MRVTRAARVSVTRTTAASSPSTMPASAMRPLVQRRSASFSFWPFSRTRQRRRPTAAAASSQTDSTSTSSPSVILPESTGKALRALGPNRDRYDRLGKGMRERRKEKKKRRSLRSPTLTFQKSSPKTKLPKTSSKVWVSALAVSCSHTMLE